jgi:molybdenum cofactor cytidylyltransferase
MADAELVLIVLAAGRGARLGGVAKALLPLEGASYLARICATARAGGAGRGAVVLGPPHDAAVAAEAQRLGLELVRNAAPERGMASSVELGFRWADERGAGAALLWPCDHPRVAAATIEALRGGLGDGDAAVPVWGGRGGHPALVARRLFAALQTCAAAPEGARSVLRAAAVRRVAVADAGCALDVDDAAARAAAEGAWVG